ncbi:hypothetical protein SDC9_97187 [bioreactor metagenome]|uniref:Uncharacterized protein n=1 Tax=bioreactor metagenome TaxID=1076179 RepID=A0A645ACM1_9ZZZZ
MSQRLQFFLDSDGNYSAYQRSAASADQAVSRAIERYAPEGGTYTDFRNSYLSGGVLLLISQSYVPAQEVLDWAVGSTGGALTSIFAWAAAGWTVEQIVSAISLQYAITIPAWYVTTLITLGNIAYWAAFEMNKQMALEVLRDGNGEGLFVKYVMSTTNYNFVKLYTDWTNYPYVPLYPNGGTASWESGVYNACF